MSSEPSERPTGAVTSVEDPSAFSPEGVRFADRHDAGRRLAATMDGLREQQPIVVGIPRGGVPVAAEVARALRAPLDVAVVRKVGAPENPEFAIGALAEGGVHVLSERSVAALRLSGREVGELLAQAEDELIDALRRYRGGREPVSLQGRTAILVDDGLATGRSAMAAVQSLRKRGAARVVLAVPVAAAESLERLREQVDEAICVEAPSDLWAVGYWYEDFSPTSDEEVAQLLAEAAARSGAGRGARTNGATEADGNPEPARTQARQVAIPIAAHLSLEGDLTLPAGARAIVAFAHGSGSSRFSPRNRAVAAALNEAGMATLLLDLLTPYEETDRRNVFDIGLLASRLARASAWLGELEETRDLALGYFGASTGAAAALSAASEPTDRARAIVSRGGRPDLAPRLEAVTVPTLLIVGGEDRQVLELNHAAQTRLGGPSELAVVPGATHLFEEPGALEQVSSLAIDWFAHRLGT